MNTVIITDIESCPKYFTFSGDLFRKNDNNTYNEIHYYDFGVDISTNEDLLYYYKGEEVEPITKEEFEAELNKAFKEILNA